MEGTIFSAKWKAVTVAVLAALATILGLLGAGLCLVGDVIVLYFLSRSFKGKIRDWIVPIGLAIWAVYCLFDFSSPFVAATNTPSVLTITVFAGVLLQSVGSVLLFVGSLFDFEYLKLFRLGALATAIGIFASFVITTAFVLKDGGSPFGMSLADIASAASVLVNVALCTALFFLAKRTK